MRPVHVAVAAMAIVFTVAALLAVPASASARPVRLHAGNMVTSRMNQTIDSGRAHNGDTFSLTVLTPYPGDNNVYTKAQLYGHITRVIAAGNGRDAVLEFDIDRMVLTNGRQAYVSVLLQAQATERHANIGSAVAATGRVPGAFYVTNTLTNKKVNVSLQQGSVMVTEVRQPAILLRPRTTVGDMQPVRLSPRRFK